MKKFKNKKLLLSLLIVFMIGLALGIVFIFIINDLDKTLISKEIEIFLDLVEKNDNRYMSLLSSFKKNALYMTLIWAIGIIPIFFPVTYFITFYKGFSIGFLFSSLMMIYKLKGLLYSIIFIFPHELINIFLLLALSTISLKQGKLLYSKIKNNECINFNPILKKYFLIYLVFLICSFISSLFEVYINSFFIKTVL